MAKIFILALLPRPVDNVSAKPLIIKFNRLLATSVNRIRKLDERVLLLPAQHQFVQDAEPIIRFFSSDGFTLSEEGSRKLKETFFKLAGFVKNS